MFKIMITGDTPEELRRQAQELADSFKVPGKSKREVESKSEQVSTNASVKPDEPMKSQATVNPPEVAPAPPQSVRIGDIKRLTEEERQARAKEIGELNRRNLASDTTYKTVHTLESVANGDVDARGLPWDERIHASSKALNKDGSWRTRRGVTPDQVKEVEANLADQAREEQSAEPSVAAVHDTKTPLPPVNYAQSGQSAHQHNPINPPVVPLAPPIVQETKPAHSFETFKRNLTQVIASLVNEGKITKEYIGQLKDYFNVKELWEIFNNETQMEELYDNFCQTGLIQRVEQ